jgi:hypothetical protein
VGDPWVDLDRDPAIDGVARVVGGPQDVAGPADIEGGERAQRLTDIDAADGEVVDLRVVGVALLDRVGEDRRVGSDADDAAVADEVGEVAGAQAVTADVVDGCLPD